MDSKNKDWHYLILETLGWKDSKDCGIFGGTFHCPLGIWASGKDSGCCWWDMRIILRASLFLLGFGVRRTVSGTWEAYIILLVTVAPHSHSRSLTVRRHSMKVRLRMEISQITRSWDCTRVLRNLEIGCTHSRLEHNLKILGMCNAISRLHKFSDCTEHIYFQKATKQGTMLPQLRLRHFQLCLVGLLHVTFISCVCYLGYNLRHN